MNWMVGLLYMPTDKFAKNDGYALVTVILATAFIMLAVQVTISSSKITGKARKNATAQSASLDVDYVIQKRLQKSISQYLEAGTQLGAINISEGISMRYSSQKIDFGRLPNNLNTITNGCPGSPLNFGSEMSFCLLLDLTPTNHDTHRANIRNANKAFLKVKVKSLINTLDQFSNIKSSVIKVDTELYWRYKKGSKNGPSIIKMSKNEFLMIPNL